MPASTRALFLLTAACMGTLQGCCVTPPTAEELLDLGYRSPTQAFQTLRAAIRGDLPRLEYRSLSAGFRRRNGLSQLSYREFRAEWYSENPWMRTALSRAEVLEVIEQTPLRTTLRVGVLGEEAIVDLVAEDFYQLWSGDELQEDVAIDDLRVHLGTEGGAWVARIPRTDVTPTELRIGREWKIDDIRQVEALDP